MSVPYPVFFFVQDKTSVVCKIEIMWYRYSRKKFKYSPVTRDKFKSVTQFSADDNAEDKPEEIDVNTIPELIPDAVESPDAAEITPEPDAALEQPAAAPILVDNTDPPVQSDNINKPNVLPPPKSPHDGCRCSKRIREKISGGYEWEVDDSMCPDCQAAAQEYNRQSMDVSGVNDPLSL